MLSSVTVALIYSTLLALVSTILKSIITIYKKIDKNNISDISSVTGVPKGSFFIKLIIKISLFIIFIKANFFEILFKSGLTILLIASIWSFYISVLGFMKILSYEDAANMVTIIVSTMTVFSFTIGFYKLFRGN